MSSRGTNIITEKQSQVLELSPISRRQYLQASATLGTIAGLAGCLGGGEDTLTTGYVLPFTGVYSLLGDSTVNGLEMYVDEQGRDRRSGS